MCENKNVISLVPIIQIVRGTRFKDINGTENVILVDCDENEGTENEDFSEEFYDYEAVKHDMESECLNLIHYYFSHIVVSFLVLCGICFSILLE